MTSYTRLQSKPNQSPANPLAKTDQIPGIFGVNTGFVRLEAEFTPLQNGTKSAQSAHLVAGNTAFAVLLAERCISFKQQKYGTITNFRRSQTPGEIRRLYLL